MKRLEKISVGDWIDLRASEKVSIKPNSFKLIPLGVAMQLPEGYEAHISPRSSTYANFRIMQTNGEGKIDNSYCGDNDMWYMPVRTFENTATIRLNDRICQFRIMKVQPKIEFTEVKELKAKDRGGFGSTGKS